MRLAAATTGPGPGCVWRDASHRKFLRMRPPGRTPPPASRRPLRTARPAREAAGPSRALVEA